MNVEHLAAGSGTAGETRRPAEADGRAWQRQLQRAQAAGWFVRADGLLSRQDVSDGSWVRPTGRPALGNWKLEARVSFPTVPSPASASAHPSGIAGQTGLHAGPYAIALVRVNGGAVNAAGTVTPGMPGLELHTTRVSPVEVDGPEQGPGSLPATASRDSRAPRIHVEEGMNGLRVWLGLDGSANEVAARVGAVVAELRRQCERCGVRLAEVTCNGVPMHTRKEP